MQKRHVVLGLVCLLVAAGAIYWFASDARRGGVPAEARAQATRTVLVEVETATAEDVRDRLDAVGTTRAVQAVDIVPLVSGRVEEIFFQPGDQVASGSPLVRLNDAAARAQAQEAQAELDRARLAFERTESLFQTSSAVSQASVEEQQSVYLTAQARHALAQDALDERTIRAPFAGTVGFRAVDVGDRVAEGTLLTTLDDLSTVEIDFAVPEIYYGSLRRGMEVTVGTLAFGRRRFRGTIAQIDTRVDPLTRSFQVRADVPNADETIPAGMFMNVGVTLERREAVVVPLDALVVRGDETFLYVVEDGIAIERPVTVGLRRRETAEIVDGLSVGERYVTKGFQNLRDGVAVEVVSSSPDDRVG